jgi:hypothetical protein
MRRGSQYGVKNLQHVNLDMDLKLIAESSTPLDPFIHLSFGVHTLQSFPSTFPFSRFTVDLQFVKSFEKLVNDLHASITKTLKSVRACRG